MFLVDLCLFYSLTQAPSTLWLSHPPGPLGPLHLAYGRGNQVFGASVCVCVCVSIHLSIYPLLKHFYPEVTHKTSTHNLVARTSHMLPPRCKEIWEMQSMAGQPSLRSSSTQRKESTLSDQQLGISARITKGRECPLVAIEMCMKLTHMRTQRPLTTYTV